MEFINKQFKQKDGLIGELREFIMNKGIFAESTELRRDDPRLATPVKTVLWGVSPVLKMLEDILEMKTN